MTVPDVQLILVLGLLCAALFSLLLRQHERHTRAAGGMLVALGDSITYGQGIPRRRERSETKLSTAVIVFLGGNDFLWPLLMRQDGFRTEAQILRASREFTETPIAATFKNIRTIIERIHAAHVKVVLVGFSTEFLDTFEEEFARIAREERVAGYVSNALAGILFNKKYLVSETVPQVHPNARGHKLIADRIQPVLEKVLQSK